MSGAIARGIGDAATRARLLSAAGQLINETGSAALTMSAVAAAAGVSRQAVYLHFGTRTGLITELLRAETANAATIPQVREGIATVPPRQLLWLWVYGAITVLSEKQVLFEAVSSAAYAGDEAAQQALTNRLEVGRKFVGRIFERLNAEGALRDGVTPLDARDWALSRIGPDIIRNLMSWSEWPRDKIVEWTYQSICRDLLKDTE